MNELKVFDNPTFGQVRSILKDDEPWFVAADVCRALEIETTATRRLDEDEKAALRLTQTSSNGVAQERDVGIVNEAGLYSLVLGSRKPEAKAFKRWIMHDVIPTICKVFFDFYFLLWYHHIRNRPTSRSGRWRLAGNSRCRRGQVLCI